MRRQRILSLLLSAIVAVVVAASHAGGNSAGAPESAAEGGCTCHTAGSTTGAATVSLDGAPAGYEAGQRVTLTVSISGVPANPAAPNQGGFAAKMEPAVGFFEATDGTVQTASEGAFATHTADGNDQREWSFDWVIPSGTAAAGDVTIFFSSNAVNGNSVPDPGDIWASGQTAVAPAEGGAPQGEDGNATTETDDGDGTPGPGVALAAGAVVAVAAVLARRRRE